MQEKELMTNWKKRNWDRTAKRWR